MPASRSSLRRFPIVTLAILASACAAHGGADTAGETGSAEARRAVPRAVLGKLLHAEDARVAALARAVADGEATLAEHLAYAEMAKHFGSHGFVPGDWQAQALAARARLAEAQPRGRWDSLGPFDYTLTNEGGLAFRSQGRATAAWGDPRPGHRGHWLVGFSGGGVWETFNEGKHWEPLTDDQPSLNVGALAADATGRTIYVGTGEQSYIFRLHIGPFGSVMLKSSDGGRTWTSTPLPWPSSQPVAQRAVGRLAIDPRRSDTVYAATSAGLMRTDDGGKSWIRVEGGGLPHDALPTCAPGVTTDATDVVIDDRVATHGAPAPIFVAIGAPFSDPRCTPNFSARAQNGIYRSLDGGATWTPIAAMGQGPFPALACAQGFGKIVLALGPPSGDRSSLYALIARPGGEGCGISPGYTGTFRSLDANAPTPTWTLRGTDAFCIGRCPFVMTGAVAPDDVDLLFLGGFELWRSTDGGAHLELIGVGSPSDPAQLALGLPGVHSDHHFLTIPVPGLVIDANDGGVWELEGAGGPLVVTDRSEGHLATLQFYGLAQHPTDADVITGGAQDTVQPTTFDGKRWADPTCGGNENSQPIWNRSDPSLVYSTFALGGIWQSTDGGRSYGDCSADPFFRLPARSLLAFGGCTQSDGPRACVPDDAAELLAPAALDPNNQDVLFDASKYLYSLVHPSVDHVDWIRYCAAGAGSACPDGAPGLTSGEDGEDISAIHIAPAGAAACNGGATSCGWLTGSNQGALFRTADGGTTWRRIDQRDLGLTPARGVFAILTHPEDHARVLVAYGGFDADARFAGEATGHLFRSLDGGATWTDVGGGLPDVPVSGLALDPADPTQVFAGTWLGVYRLRDAWGPSPTIENASFNLPNAMVFALGFSPANGRLRVATHGRGIWELRRSDEPDEPETE
jgi:hypothetical protein